jgi:3'-phosphoadenosine 5'-phosphosulfate sulfotransferase
MTIWRGEKRAKIAEEMYERYYRGRRLVECNSCGSDREIAWSFKSLGDKYYCSFATVRNLIEEHEEKIRNDPNRSANKDDVDVAMRELRDSPSNQ